MNTVRFTYPAVASIDTHRGIKEAYLESPFKDQRVVIKLAPELNLKDGDTFNDFIIDKDRCEIIRIIS